MQGGVDGMDGSPLMEGAGRVLVAGPKVSASPSFRESIEGAERLLILHKSRSSLHQGQLAPCWPTCDWRRLVRNSARSGRGCIRPPPPQDGAWTARYLAEHFVDATNLWPVAQTTASRVKP